MKRLAGHPCSVATNLRAGSLLLMTGLGIVLSFAPPSAAADTPSNADPVILAGQEDMLAEMLGRGAFLPAECTFTGGGVDQDRVRATYGCRDGTVAIALLHPSRSPVGATRTDDFAIVVERGSLPRALEDTLVSRIRAHEGAVVWQWLPRRSPLEQWLSVAVIFLPLAAVVSAGVTAASRWRRRWRVAVQAGDQRAVRPSATMIIRVAGLAAILIISLYGVRVRWNLGGTLATILGVFPLVAFLWLFASGAFGYGSAGRRDWVGVAPFLIALVVREVFTLHSVQEIEIQFSDTFIGRHSIVYPLLQMFYAPLLRDAQSFTMHLNGVLGAFASLALYLFVRQRSGSRAAGWLCALFLGIHPVIARFAPTDGPYSFLLAAWFSGLALLSADTPGAASMVGGAGLLGIAATARIEGVAFLCASALMLDPKVLIERARRDRAVATCSLLLVAALVAVHWYFLLPFHLGHGTPPLPNLNRLIGDAVWPLLYNERMFTVLVWIGAAAGVLRRYRLGLLAYIGMVIVLVPVVGSGDWPVSMHRMIPTCALQAIVAGIGASALTGWIDWRRRWQWMAIVPGTLVAGFILVSQWSALTRPYVFTHEYDLVRTRLAVGGIPDQACTLLTFNSDTGVDADLNDFRQVVPGMRVLDCDHVDCRAAVAPGGCFYYVRSVACYFRSAGVLPACAESGVTAAGDRSTCLSQSSAAFERAVALQAVEVRMIDIRTTFPGGQPQYPEKAEVGLFRVQLPRAAVP